MKKINKRKVAGLLAACVVATTLSPALPAYARKIPWQPGNPQTETKFVFDAGLGPAGKWSAGDPDVTLEGRNRIMTGAPGETLVTKYSELNKDPEDYDGYGGLEKRPALPAPVDIWPGYTWAGWYEEANGVGNRVKKLPYVFEYDYEAVTYFSHWISDGTQYPYHIVHERTLPSGNYVEFLKEDFDRKAGESISGAPKRSSAPGYTYQHDLDPAVESAKIVPEKQPLFNGNPSDIDLGSFNGSNYKYSGKMANRETTLTYRYVPNTEKKYNLRIEYINENNDVIKKTDIFKLHAEEPLSGTGSTLNSYSIPAIPGYGNVISKAIIKGNGDHTSSPQGDNANGVDASGNAQPGWYSWNYAGGDWNGDLPAGWMPNQDVTIQYQYEVDNNYEVPVKVQYIDNTDANIADQIDTNIYRTVYNWNPNPMESTHNFSLAIPTVSGYLSQVFVTGNMSGSSGSSISVTVSGQSASISLDRLPSTSDNITIKITYKRDPAVWADVNIQHGANGGYLGDYSTRSYRIGKQYSLSELVGQLTLTPDANYTFEDQPWYVVNSDGSLVKATDTITLNSDLTLRACFIKDPAKWHDVTFVAGNHGTITNIGVQNVVEGTQLSTLAHPGYTADPGYSFDGWYDQNTNPVNLAADPVNGPIVIEAKFTFVAGDSDYLTLNRPNANGQIGNNGTGEVVISDMIDGRYYAVVDENGQIIDIVTGNNNVVGGLNPSSDYQVYELDPLVKGPSGQLPTGNISDIPSVLKSDPTTVRIPAVGDNASVEADQSSNGKMQIVIDPTAPDTVYALMDEDGNVVSVSHPGADNSGWVTPENGKVIFDNLDPNTNYTVVAKEKTDSAKTPVDKGDYGSNVYTDDQAVIDSLYTLSTINGKIRAIDGQPVNVDYKEAAAGKAVRAVALPTSSSGAPFVTWKVLLGDIGVTPGPGVDTLNFDMPAENVLLVAIYNEPLIGTNSNATLGYNVIGTGVAMNLLADQVEQMRELVTQPEDEAVLATSGRTVHYDVVLKKRPALASESNAVKDHRTAPDDAYRGAWAIETDLRRYVDGDPRPVIDGTDPGPFEVYFQMDKKDQGKAEYQLWEIITAPNGTVYVNEIPMTQDPNAVSNGKGLFKFTGQIDAVYVLSYSNVHKVKITNLKTGYVNKFDVYHKEVLGDNTNYTSWKAGVPLVITDPDGKPWIYKGLSTKNNSMSPFRESTKISSDKELYAYYEVDSDWVKSKDRLEDLIDQAEKWLDQDMSEEQKDKLENAIRDAENLLGERNPGPTKQELDDAYNNLKNVMENAGGSAEPEKPEPEKPEPEEPEPEKPEPPIIPPTPGGGGSGGGGGGGSSSAPRTTGISNGYPTYTVGTDGNWQLIDARNHLWVFNLNNGNRITGWANLKFTYEGQTLTYRYHFSADGVMDFGWYKDDAGRWYYFSLVHDGWFGHMVTGWHLDPADGKWYYLDPNTGVMTTGWREINGVWYYFTEHNQRQTWEYNEQEQKWEYIAGNTENPYGSMFAAEATPDGYQVNESGAWVK